VEDSAVEWMSSLYSQATRYPQSIEGAEIVMKISVVTRQVLNMSKGEILPVLNINHTAAT